MTSLAPAELVERLWARDSTLWTGRDENRWLGWLDEPLRMRERVAVFGGSLDAARTDDGGFVVAARLPVRVAT